MNGAGVKNLGSVSITAALTDFEMTSASLNGAAVKYVPNLGGMVSLTAWANFVYGSGGTSAILRIQTSLDQADNWIDVIRMDFAQASRKMHATVGIFAAAAPAVLAALGAEGKLDNILGDRVRAILTTTGTYAATSLAVRMAVR